MRAFWPWPSQPEQTPSGPIVRPGRVSGSMQRRQYRTFALLQEYFRAHEIKEELAEAVGVASFLQELRDLGPVHELEDVPRREQVLLHAPVPQVRQRLERRV